MYQRVPTAFVPVEDQGYFLILVQTPPGASLSYTTDFADRVASKVLVGNEKDIFGTFSVMGFSLSGGSSPNSGLIFAPLQPVDDRTKLGKGHDAHSIVARIAPQLFCDHWWTGMQGARRNRPPRVSGTVGGFQFILQDAGRARPSATSTASPTRWSARPATQPNGLSEPEHNVYRERPAASTSPSTARRL